MEEWVRVSERNRSSESISTTTSPERTEGGEDFPYMISGSDDEEGARPPLSALPTSPPQGGEISRSRIVLFECSEKSVSFGLGDGKQGCIV